MLTRKQAEALTALVLTIRPEWNENGVMNALLAARDMGTGTDVMHAAIACANRTEVNTPAVIAHPGSHWRHTYVRQRSTNTTPPRSRTCGICYLDRAECEARWAQDHDYEPMGSARSDEPDPDLLSEIRTTLFTRRLCRHKVDLNVARCYQCMGTVPQRPLLPQVKGGRPVEDVELP